MKKNKQVNKQDFLDVHDLKHAHLKNIADRILDHKKFYMWSGSGHEGQHHYGVYGLAIHTLEVIKFMFACVETMQLDVNKDILFLAGLFHDIGKLEDYTFRGDEWVSTDHKRNIHHISKSAMIFFEVANKVDLKVDLREQIIHCILSHHTTREYGSPVAPNSKEAWLLTLCDNMSARMDDCGTWEYVIKKK